jgi:peptidoglycan/LPS O-acetylase OafA/YrhL
MGLSKPVGLTNNFDLIRLIAAVQVVLIHAIEHLNILQRDSSIFLALMHFLPGVPIFFFVSGFLIANSFKKNENLRTYSFNRFVRIYPALWVCFLLSVISVVMTGYLPVASIFSSQFFAWMTAQLSMLQFYNPEFMRNYATGVLNGSLWTICVELQFYVLMPLLAKLIRYKKIYVTILIMSFALNMMMSYTNIVTGITVKLLGVSFLPWVAMFMLGHLCFDQWSRIGHIFSGKFGWWAGIYTISAIAGYFLQNALSTNISGNQLAMPLQLLLAALVLSAAFSYPSLAHKLLRKHDVSYGLYIYHMPVINVLLFYEFEVNILALPVVILSTFALAIGSWLLVERPSLQRKALK